MTNDNFMTNDEKIKSLITTFTQPDCFLLAAVLQSTADMFLTQLTPDHSEVIHSAPVHDPALQSSVSAGRELPSHQASGRMSASTPGMA